MDHVTLACPSCNRSLRIRSSYLGLMVTCKYCANDFRVRDYVPIECPQCRTGLDVRRDYLGRRVTCKRCGHAFVAHEHASHSELALDDTVFAGVPEELLDASIRSEASADAPTEIYDTPDEVFEPARPQDEDSSANIETQSPVVTGSAPSPALDLFAEARQAEAGRQEQQELLRRQVEELRTRVAELEPLASRLAATHADLDRVRGRRNQLKDDLDQTLTLYERAKVEIARLTEAAASHDEALGFSQQEVAALKRQLDEVNERTDFVTRERDELRHAVLELRDQVAREVNEREMRESELAEARDELAHARQEVAGVNEKLVEATLELAGLSGSFEQLQSQEKQTSARLSQLECAIEAEREQRRVEAEAHQAGLSAERQRFEEAHVDTKAALDAAYGELEVLRSELGAIQTACDAARSENAEAHQASVLAQKCLTEAQARWERERPEWEARLEQQRQAASEERDALQRGLQEIATRAEAQLDEHRRAWQEREEKLGGQLSAARERIDGLTAELEHMAETRAAADAEVQHAEAELRSEIESLGHQLRSARERERSAIHRADTLHARIIKFELELAAAHDSAFEGSLAQANQRVAQLGAELETVSRKYQNLRGQLRSMGINIG